MAVIAGNWKMHMGPADTRAFFGALDLSEVGAHHEMLLFPPAVSLPVAATSPDREARVQLGVQNVHWEEQGAFTGECSVPMAGEAGADFVLIGHSERRHVFGETDEEVALKIGATLRGGLTPVVCVGETLDERRAGRLEEVLLRQLDAALTVLAGHEARFLIAYEPVWAIGTGETATPDDASSAHAVLRARMEEALGLAVAARTPILYGGSVKPGNAAELMSAPDVDGVLVGGASMTADSFASIAAAAG